MPNIIPFRESAEQRPLGPEEERRDNVISIAVGNTLAGLYAGLGTEVLDEEARHNAGLDVAPITAAQAPVPVAEHQDSARIYNFPIGSEVQQQAGFAQPPMPEIADSAEWLDRLAS